MSEITARWRAYRAALERGDDRSLAYDYFLHPRTRADIHVITEEFPHVVL